MTTTGHPQPWKVPFMRPDLPGYSQVARSIEAAFASGLLTKGSCLVDFEREASRVLGTSDAVGVSSCTTGLMLVLSSLRQLSKGACRMQEACSDVASGVGSRDEIIVPSFIFLAAPAAIVWAGYRPVFVDVDPETFTISPVAVRAAVSPRTAAVLGCHTFGCPCDLDGLAEITASAGIPLIIDAAHGFGAERAGRQVGAGGLAQVFSLSPTKLVVAGEGGLVATSCGCLAEAIRVGREYGNDGRYSCDTAGVNGRLPEISAIIGAASLARLPLVAERRRQAAGAYIRALSGVPGIRFQKIPPDCESSWKDFCIAIEEPILGMSRDELRLELAARGIDTRAYYSPACHQMPAFARFADAAAQLPVTHRLAATLLALPMGEHVTPGVAQMVAGEIRGIMSQRTTVPHGVSD